MAIDQYSPAIISIHPVTLEFDDRSVEIDYRHYFFRLLRRQARLGLVVGITLWTLYSLLDFGFAPISYPDTAWYIRILVILLASAVLGASFHSIFNRFNQLLLILVGLVVGAGLLAMMWLLTEGAISRYFPGLMLLIFWSHCFAGLRFVHASFTSIILFLAFNLLFGVARPISMEDLLSYNCYMLAANVLAACASYLSERQGRVLFLGKRELDLERTHHLTRSLHDNLTGLPNRELLEDRLELAISQSSRDERSCAGLFIDLDDFKSINDTYGHEIGDKFLQEVAVRLTDIMREADTLSRIGGDEFFVLARDIPKTNAASIFAKKLLHQLQEPYILNDVLTLPGITASIGVCIFPYKHCSPVDIIRRADQAMYEIKRSNKGGVAFART